MKFAKLLDCPLLAFAVLFASCISKGNPIGFPCPNFEKMRKKQYASQRLEIVIDLKLV